MISSLHLLIWLGGETIKAWVSSKQFAVKTSNRDQVRRHQVIPLRTHCYPQLKNYGTNNFEITLTVSPILQHIIEQQLCVTVYYCPLRCQPVLIWSIHSNCTITVTGKIHRFILKSGLYVLHIQLLLTFLFPLGAVASHCGVIIDELCYIWIRFMTATYIRQNNKETNHG